MRGRMVSFFLLSIGIVLLLIYYFTLDPKYIVALYLFIAVGCVISLFIIIRLLLWSTHVSRRLRTKAYVSVALIFMNAPMAYFALLISEHLQNTLRITLVNTLPEPVSNLKILGCEEIEIPSLSPNERREVSVTLSQKCSITITYLFKGHSKSERSVSNLGPGMGCMTTHYIDGKNKSNLRTSWDELQLD